MGGLVDDVRTHYSTSSTTENVLLANLLLIKEVFSENNILQI